MNITKLHIVLAAIACAAAAGLIYLFVPALQGNLAPGLVGLALLLIGYAKQNFVDAAKLANASTTTTVTESVTQPMTNAVDLPTARKTGGTTPSMPVILALIVGLSLLSSLARAQTPSDVAPPLSFCFGSSTTCVVPDSGLQAVTYDLNKKQWSGGVSSAGLGYALLFMSDTPYASGFSLHATFDFSQSAPSFLAPTFAVVLLHYFEAGYTPVFYDGRIGQQITLMVGLNAEKLLALLTGKPMAVRLAAARAAGIGAK